nr:hypothetical protein [bacterium]
MKKVKKSPPTSEIKEPKKDRELPVTKRLLDLKIQEFKGDITSLRLEMKADFTKVDGKIESLRSQMNVGFQEQDAKFEALDTKITKMMVLLEDQNDRNRATLDANTHVYEKIVENDSRVEKLEERVFGGKQR